MAELRRVAYYYHPDVSDIIYSSSHVMKPFRATMVYEMLKAYGVLGHHNMRLVQPELATDEELAHFHNTKTYLRYLSTMDPYVFEETPRVPNLRKTLMGTEDCPVYVGMIKHARIAAGGSIGCATRLINGDADITINWSGGLHHSAATRAYGFCYVNDIVLAILELLKRFRRVVYIDIDVHHGDGVESAFYNTNRVLTVSFHMASEFFFPGTGTEVLDANHNGIGKGTYYSLNIPLKSDIRSAKYTSLFKEIMGKVMEKYQPEAIVLQCGGDSLAGDRLGGFNIKSDGHAECVKFMRSFNLPMILLGGGGYVIRNVARCWAYETMIALGVEGEFPREIPDHKFVNFYGGQGLRDHREASIGSDMNTTEHIREIKRKADFVISQWEHVPNAMEEEDDEEKEDDDE